MLGKFMTTNTDSEVKTSNIKVVEIGDLSFEMDERLPWIYVYVLEDGEKTEILEIIDEIEKPTIKRICFKLVL